MKRKIFSVLLALVLALSFSLVTAVPVAAAAIDLAVNDENPWTDGAFTFENISPGGDPMAFDFKLHNVGDDPGILTFSMSVSENDMAGAPAPNMSADAFASLVYVEAVHYQFKWPADPEKQPGGYIGAVKDDLPNWLGMDLNTDGKVSLYEICQVGIIPYSAENDPLDPTAEITYFIEFQLGDSLDGGVAGGAILTGVEDKDAQGDGISVAITATLEEDVPLDPTSDTEQSSGNVFQAGTTWPPAPVTIGENGYYTIQPAIDAALAGDTINVAAGTYIEDLVIPDTKTNLELAGASGATIKGVANVPKVSWPLGVPNIEILAGGVKIHGFTIEGPDYVADYYASGIILDGIDIEIYDNDFVTTAADTTDELAHAITTISKAVLPTADVSGLNIHNNTFTGFGAVGSEFIYINPHTGSGTVTIDTNQFSGSTNIGITVESGNTIVNNNIISSNLGYETEPYGTYGMRFMDTSYLETYDNIVISNNSIQDFKRAIRVGNGGVGASVFTAVISNNTLTNNDIGVWGRLGNHITAVNNTIVGNTVGVQNDDATVTINAENNWWGDISGPDGEGTGSGDAVSTDVDYIPWLDAEGGAATYPAEINGVGYDTIQDAVTAALSGETVTVSPGTYTGDITINEDITLVSSGSSEVTKLTGTGPNPVVTIGDFTVTLDGFEIGPGDEGVYIYDITAGNVVTIEDSVIHGNAHQGIWVEGTVYGTLNILNNIIADNDSDDGIVINKVDDGGSVVIQGNVIGAWEDADYDLSGNGWAGIYIYYIYDGSTVTIGGDEAAEANIICENGNEGIYVDDMYYGCTLTIEGNTIGAYAYDGYTFAGNGQDNSYDGVYIDYVDYGSTLTIKDNDITENTCGGIDIEQIGYDWSTTATEYCALYQTWGANYVTIEGNDISRNDDDGIYICEADFAAYLTIQDNTISGNSDDGIEIEYLGDWAGSGYGEFYLDEYTADVRLNPAYPDYFGPVVLIKGNTITDNAYYGIYQSNDWEFGTSVTIEDNVITENLDAGIYHYYDVTNDAHVLIRGNTIASNGFSGGNGGIYWSWDEYIDYASSYTVENNLIAGNWGDGIYIYGVCDDSTLIIRGNTIGAGADAQGSQYPGNDGFGIYIEYVWYDSTAEISRNTISGNSSYGIDIEEVYEYSSADITRNIITENDEGIFIDYVYDDGSVSITRNDILDNGSYGIYIYDVYESSTAGSVDAHYNNIAGNSYGVYYSYDSMDEYVDATNNWWGSATGPAHASNLLGTGDSVSDNVTFSPWLPQWYPPAPAPVPPPPPTIDTELFDTEASFETNSDGEIQETIVATSEDENVTITIEEGTIALDEEGEPLETLTAAVEPSPPEPPEDAYLIGAYDFGPAGATFDPAITLTWSYDPETLPEDVDLVIAYYDEVNEEWVWVPCEVDTENNIITASVAHFTTFAIIAVPVELPPVVIPPVPAVFSVSYLSVSPRLEVEPGETVTITVLVANIGGESGSYTVVLKIDEVKEAEESVTIAASESQDVSFSVTREEAGSYTVTVDGLSGSFTVVPVVVPPEPAAFSVSSISVLPAEVEPGDTVTIAVSVANAGGESGSYTVVLNIDGVKEAEETVTVAAGESQDVSFNVTREEADSYTVAVDGLSGSFTVVAPVVAPAKPGINWAMIGGIIGGVIVVGLGVFFWMRRREY